MNVSFHFTVIGIPQPQGSTKAFVIKGTNRCVVTSTNKKNKPWRSEVANAALLAIETFGFPPQMDGQAVEVNVEFFFDKPKSTHRSVTQKTTKPDIDKLLRSIFDALTGVAYKDDSQIVKVVATKQFGNPPGVRVTVRNPDFTEQKLIPMEDTCKAFGADWD